MTSGDDFQKRAAMEVDYTASRIGMGRELFAAFREKVSSAESGASIFGRSL
ncbi:MAG: hypothetical protein OEY04_16720 [Gammaproteobacteria bacterium]|nr:hypothetical protein [Gammaproteobacteria bacterium]